MAFVISIGEYVLILKDNKPYLFSVVTVHDYRVHLIVLFSFSPVSSMQSRSNQNGPETQLIGLDRIMCSKQTSHNALPLKLTKELSGAKKKWKHVFDNIYKSKRDDESHDPSL